MRPTAPGLVDLVSDVIQRARQGGRLAELERVYLENPERLRARRLPRFREGGDILSPWDGLFRAAGTTHGFDWRLLAALSFAESGYDPWSVSSAGAMGLLQLMPATAEAFGARDPFDPAQNVAAGARHLRWLYDQYQHVPDPDRIAFALAAYNMGLGHVADVRALAAQRGLNPDRWDGHVARVLPLKENEAIAASMVHGVARGRVTLRYVEHVLDLYDRFTHADQQARAVFPPRPLVR
jgi:membrane-bound lytic murein transglycosylase F